MAYAGRSLADLADERRSVEGRISRQIASTVTTDADRASNARALHMLHEELASILEAIETASWSVLPMAEVGIGSALRWAVTGAVRTADFYRDSAIAWQQLADGPDAR